jgi:ubiquinone biosynthesis protein UbiJ
MLSETKPSHLELNLFKEKVLVLNLRSFQTPLSLAIHQEILIIKSTNLLYEQKIINYKIVFIFNSNFFHRLDSSQEKREKSLSDFASLQVGLAQEMLQRWLKLEQAREC